jgi:hypothetical protein
MPASQVRGGRPPLSQSSKCEKCHRQEDTPFNLLVASRHAEIERSVHSVGGSFPGAPSSSTVFPQTMKVD